jgi:transposase
MATKKAAPAKKTEKAPQGRKTLLTPELQDQIVELIRLGNYAQDAAGACGISEATYYNWLDRGKVEAERLKLSENSKPKAEEKPFLEFLEAVEKARREATARNVAVIQKAAIGGTWQAAAWWLERTRQNTFGRKERVEHTGAEGGDMKISVEMGDLEDKIAQVLATREK